jgi:hypothetical protein
MKGAERMMSEIKAQTGAHGCKNILMVDNIMPHDYFSTLLPMLADARLDLRIFYEQKANLTAARMRRISDAGINIIQPGIESLSDDLLVLMRKGVKSWQNIAALRHARMCDVYVNWNLLTSFPGDRISHYKDQERLVPLLHHLCPPSGLNQLSIDRFSPYFDTPERFGITNIRPMASYSIFRPGRLPKRPTTFTATTRPTYWRIPSCCRRSRASSETGSPAGRTTTPHRFSASIASRRTRFW